VSGGRADSGWAGGFVLRDLPLGARIGLTAIVLVFAIGLAASAAHIREHHENRDERPGVSLEDLQGAYHGVRTTSPLVAALERGHPSELAAGDREALLAWLRSDRISEDYDNLDLGDAAPAERIAAGCAGCHSRKAGGTPGKVPLEYWDDVKPLAFSRQVAPVPLEVLTASTHAHALSLAAISAVIGLLLLATRWRRSWTGALLGVGGVALVTDFAAQWLARDSAGWVPVIAASGALWAASSALSLAAITLDLWLGRRTPDAGH
jgi:hypothetical protein